MLVGGDGGVLEGGKRHCFELLVSCPVYVEMLRRRSLLWVVQRGDNGGVLWVYSVEWYEMGLCLWMFDGGCRKSL